MRWPSGVAGGDVLQFTVISDFQDQSDDFWPALDYIKAGPGLGSFLVTPGDISPPGPNRLIIDLQPDEDIELLHRLWLRLSAQGPGYKLHHRDVVRVALRRLEWALESNEADTILEQVKQVVAKAPPAPAQ